jgi:hypothetical protein
MICHSSELPPEDDAEKERPIITAREVITIREALDELASARCPLCRAVLVARQGRAGPYFFCQCVRQPTKRAS